MRFPDDGCLARSFLSVEISLEIEEISFAAGRSTFRGERSPP
jgi:hypothetical protein